MATPAHKPQPDRLDAKSAPVKTPQTPFPTETRDSRHNLGQSGILIINADDWGRNRRATDQTLDCVARGTVSSASAMVFMEDSERAAELAREAGLDTGLHLNLTTTFSAPGVPTALSAHHERLIRYLRSNRFAQAFYHPALRDSFEYVVKAQFEEYARLHGQPPQRIDGHHHKHLCANVLFGGLLPEGIIARRNTSFFPGQKSSINVLYRSAIDRMLARHYRVTDFFFPLPPFEPANRLERIFTLARTSAVEVETHPEIDAEHRFLTGEILDRTGDVPIALGFARPFLARVQ
jgi:predicted glycoside hydrolase/deacetylase ChbG (UPF0249 family)